MSFIEWFLSNWYANCFTIITVVLSGLISLIISAVYYRKGNRNNLKMAVIHPIIRLLQDAYSRKNYDKLNEIRSSDIAFTMGAKGPLLQKAHNFQGSIEQY